MPSPPSPSASSKLGIPFTAEVGALLSQGLDRPRGPSQVSPATSLKQEKTWEVRKETGISEFGLTETGPMLSTMSALVLTVL